MDTPEERAPTVEEKILFPARYVKLLSEEQVLVEPWGVEEGQLLNPQCMALMGKMDGDFDMERAASLILEHQAEVIEIVRLTIGWTTEEMADKKRIRYEDVLTLAQAVIEVCILRGQDMGGIMGKAVALGVLSLAQRNVANNSSQPLSSSSQTDTPGAMSTVTPPSK